jgi:hypothetical protein
MTDNEEARMRWRVGVGSLVVVLAAMIGAAACSSSGGSGGGGGGQPQLTITEPANGASVQVPFTLKFTSSVQLGPTESGRDHVHVFADGKTDEYTVVPTTTFVVKDLSPGQHKIGVTLQHADHSSAGASAEVTVMVTGAGSGGAPSTQPSSASSSGSRYGY